MALRSSRTPRLPAFAVVGLSWVLAVVGGIEVVVRTRVGPVVIPVAPGHGLHAGDVAALAVAIVFASSMTGALLGHLRS